MEKAESVEVQKSKKSGTRTVKVPLDFPMVDQRDCRRQLEALVFQPAPIVSDSEQSDNKLAETTNGIKIV